MKISWAKRIAELPPYLFAELDRQKATLREQGVDIIDLSIGDPDLPTPETIIGRLSEAAREPAHHRYPPYAGTERFRNAVALWYKDRFGVQLDPQTEVLALIGSKEGIGHLPLGLIDPGDRVLFPDPGYPVYATATSFAGGIPVAFPLTKEEGFKPRLDRIPAKDLERAKLLFLNYPNNPTSAVAQLSDFESYAEFARKHELLVCHDAAYTEVSFGGFECPSFLELKGSKDYAIEFHSLSKTFNMTGWRVGFAVGNAQAITALGKVKSNLDSGVFGAIQEAGITALENWRELRDANNVIYEHRRDMMIAGLKRLGIQCQIPRATFYVWCDLPSKEKSTDFCTRILKECGVQFTPGVGFGKHGEGYFRIALTASEVRLQEAVARLQRKL